MVLHRRLVAKLHARCSRTRRRRGTMTVHGRQDFIQKRKVPKKINKYMAIGSYMCAVERSKDVLVMCRNSKAS